jgi:hypothetical protein
VTSYIEFIAMATETKQSNYFDRLYAEAIISDEDLMSLYDEIRYHGFDRNQVLKELELKVPDTKVAMYIVLTCALNGPQRAVNSKLPGGRTPGSYGIPASGMQRTKGISCQRITAATADLAAFLMKRLNVPKRLNLDCPGWLQFPSAGSITMPPIYRQQHIEFSRRFSTVIGGTFNESIYMQMINNSYIKPELKELLFDNVELEKVQVNPIIPPIAPSGTIATNPPSGQAVPNPALSSASSASSSAIKTKPK